MLFVQHNLLAENANRQLKVSTGKNAKTTEKLSSGYRINRAADDAAGLSISEKMRRQVRGLHQTVDNISEGVGYVQTAEGALNEVHDMLQRMNELAVKAANGTNTEEDRAYIDSEVQALKSEMDRIFRTTTFNERKIWEPGERRLLGYQTVRAVQNQGTSQYNVDVTNKNYMVLPGGYSYSSDGSFRGYFEVCPEPDPPDDQTGIKIGWKGYDGEQYYTKGLDWDTLKQEGYDFEMSDYFDKDVYPALFDGDQPVFKHRIAFSPAETATEEDIAYSITGCKIPVTAHASMYHAWEDKNSHFSVGNVVLNYSAAFASLFNSTDGHNFDAKDDAFLEEVKTGGTNLTTCPKYAGATPEEKVSNARKDTTNWEFSFYMKGIGEVKGSSASITYSCNDRTDAHEHLWWHYREYYDYKDGKWKEDKNTKYGNSKSIAGGSLADVMDALTGDEASTHPGILNKDLQGCNAGTDGSITIHFNLTSKDAFVYTNANGDKTDSHAVGGFSLSFSVGASETEDHILGRIEAALNGSSVLDFYSNSGGSDDVDFGSLNTNYKGIQAPIYGGICGFYVQAGTEGGQHISVQYESLSTIVLGLEHTNTRTQESAGRAINEIKGALQMVSEQRSTFGAYQNRIEHARNINANVEENTQAAESRIRDADIADLMMEYSINNILMQAGTSMLTQANQSSQSILELLQ